MAKYQVVYACGCTGEVTLFGKGTERARKLEWLATQDCYRCARKAGGVRGVLTISARDETGVPTAVRVTLVGDTFPVKDEIKAAGYRFSKDALWHDPLGARVEAGWFQTFDVTDGAEALAAEVERVVASG